MTTPATTVNFTITSTSAAGVLAEIDRITGTALPRGLANQKPAAIAAALEEECAATEDLEVEVSKLIELLHESAAWAGATAPPPVALVPSIVKAAIAELQRELAAERELNHDTESNAASVAEALTDRFNWLQQIAVAMFGQEFPVHEIAAKVEVAAADLAAAEAIGLVLGTIAIDFAFDGEMAKLPAHLQGEWHKQIDVIKRLGDKVSDLEGRLAENALERQLMWDVIDEVAQITGVLEEGEIDARWRELPALIQESLDREGAELREALGRGGTDAPDPNPPARAPKFKPGDKVTYFFPLEGPTPGHHEDFVVESFDAASNTYRLKTRHSFMENAPAERVVPRGASAPWATQTPPVVPLEQREASDTTSDAVAEPERPATFPADLWDRFLAWRAVQPIMVNADPYEYKRLGDAGLIAGYKPAQEAAPGSSFPPSGSRVTVNGKPGRTNASYGDYDEYGEPGTQQISYDDGTQAWARAEEITVVEPTRKRRTKEEIEAERAARPQIENGQVWRATATKGDRGVTRIYEDDRGAWVDYDALTKTTSRPANCSLDRFYEWIGKAAAELEDAAIAAAIHGKNATEPTAIAPKASTVPERTLKAIETSTERVKAGEYEPGDGRMIFGDVRQSALQLRYLLGTVGVEGVDERQELVCQFLPGQVWDEKAKLDTEVIAQAAAGVRRALTGRGLREPSGHVPGQKALPIEGNPEQDLPTVSDNRGVDPSAAENPLRYVTKRESEWAEGMLERAGLAGKAREDFLYEHFGQTIVGTFTLARYQRLIWDVLPPIINAKMGHGAKPAAVTEDEFGDLAEAAHA